MDNRQALIDWITQLIKDLSESPDELSFKATVDERGLLITVFAPSSQLGSLIGKEGRTAEALRTILSVYGIRKGAHCSLKIQDSAR